jgi:hypothetical protein
VKIAQVVERVAFAADDAQARPPADSEDVAVSVSLLFLSLISSLMFSSESSPTNFSASMLL